MKIVSRSPSSRPGQYPVATIATYGPDSTLATKLVVSVLGRPGRRDPSATRTWTTQAVDVRHDPAIAAEVASFVQQHHAKQTVSYDRIIGCPHEEGIDYPMGRTCPRCPFWAGIDRFTHEPVTPPVPTMAPAEILADLSSDEPEPPREALESADGHRPVLVEPLLRALDCGLANPSGASPEEATLFCYALYLLAKWREPRAYPYVVRWLSLPGEAPFRDCRGCRHAGRRADSGCSLRWRPGADQSTGRRSERERVRPRRGRDSARPSGRMGGGATRVHRHHGFCGWRGRDSSVSPVKCGTVWRPTAPTSKRCCCSPSFAVPMTTVSSSRSSCIHPNWMKSKRRLAAACSRRRESDTRPLTMSSWRPLGGDASRMRRSPPSRRSPIRAPPKVGRNEPCPCGSGKKFKKCCGG